MPDEPTSDAQAKMHPALEALTKGLKAQHVRLQAHLLSLQDALDHLRIVVKYLKFDLEATQRERDYYKNLYENSANGEEGA